MKHEIAAPIEEPTREIAPRQRRPYQAPMVKKLGTLARVVQQSGVVTMSGGRT